MDASRVHRIREDMERAEARRLQPHYIESFFLEAFQRLGGTAKQREPRRYEVTHVPAPVRNRDRLIGIGEPVLPRYERIAFEKALVAPPGPAAGRLRLPRPSAARRDDRPDARAPPRPAAARHRAGGRARPRHRAARAVLPRARHPGRRASPARASAASSPSGCSTSSSTPTATTRHLHYAPYLDYRPLAEDEPGVDALLDAARVRLDRPRAGAEGAGLRRSRTSCRSTSTEVRDRKLALIAKTEAAVKDRLTKEITYWDHRAEQLKLQEQAGKPNARLNSGEARKRADELQARLQKRHGGAEARSADLAAAAGGARRPAGRARWACSRAMTGEPTAPTAASSTRRPAPRGRAPIVMEVERGLGFEPTDREFEKLGYDIESRVPGTGKLRFIEVKGRVAGADDDHRHHERDPLLAQQAGRLHPRHRRVPATTTRTACTTCASRSSASRTSA